MVRRQCWGVIICTGVLLLVQDIVAQETTGTAGQVKQPWEWTIEERLAERFDPNKVEQRHQQAVDKALQGDSRLLKRKVLHDPSRTFIDGSETPELFLPWELFNALVYRAFLADPEFCTGFREQAQERAGAFGRRDDLWPMLEQLGWAFIELDRERHTIGRTPEYHNPKSEQYQELHEKHESVELQLCRTRFEALNIARKHFGETAFNRFLYEAVAPEYNVSYDWDGRGIEEIAVKRWVAGGCQ